MGYEITLKKELGLFEATLCGIGIIFGAGIYALIGKAAGFSGNGLWLSFLIAAFAAALTGLSYAELSSMFPKAGAEYVYTENSFGKRLAFIVGWLIIFSGIIGAAAVSLGFAGYFSVLFHTPIVATAFMLIVLLSFLLFYGIKQSAWFAIISTLVESAGLLIVIAIGLPYLGNVNYLAVPDFSGVFAASSLIFFAFIGFEEIVRLSEETHNAERTIPKALILSILITAVIYILVGAVSIGAIGPEKLAASSAPLAEVVSVTLGRNAFVILAVIALFATSNTVLLMMLASSRITYGMAKEKSLPKIFSYVHSSRRTPLFATALVAILSFAFVFVKDIVVVAEVTNFTIFSTFIIVNAALIILRYSKPKAERHFKTPLNIGKFPLLAFAGVLVSFFMLANIGKESMLYGLILLISGFAVYEGYGTYKTKIIRL